MLMRAMARRRCFAVSTARGFTLIELLVAISLMALMAVMAWSGLDGMTRAQAQMRQHSDAVLTLQAGLAQWEADLDALASQPNTPSLDWDGRALRILRRSANSPAEGLRVVAWASRSIDGVGHWLRWQSPPLKTRGQLQAAWDKAALWAQNPGDDERKGEVRIVPLERWQIFYSRNTSWGNPLSSEGVAADGKAAAIPSIPDGVRLMLSLPAGPAISGTLTRDWMRPGLGGGK
jgi:general secretion pathway protein J